MTTIIAPAKIILSGEHAVVYGAPALAMAVNRYCHVQISPSSPNTLSHTSSNFLTATSHERYDTTFCFTDIPYCLTTSIANLSVFLEQAQLRYHSFMRGENSSDTIFSAPHELVLYTYISFLSRLATLAITGKYTRDKTSTTYDTLRILCAQLAPNLLPHQLTIATNIPIGCGMGSSAALIVALGQTLFTYVNAHVVPQVSSLTPAAEIFLEWAKDIENLQHGVSSGVDLHLSYYGATALIENGQYHHQKATSVPFILINTGKPQVTTATCVSHVRRYFDQPHALRANTLLDDFAAITRAMEQATQRNDCLEMQRCIRENHKLLCTIGVVPTRTQEFIAVLSKYGIAAKISGAGASVGENAGIVLAVSDSSKNTNDDEDRAKQAYIQNVLNKITKEYGYEMLVVRSEQHGVRKVTQNAANTTAKKSAKNVV